MASTDDTQWYHLSQFRDSDKPTWRGDYNSDMSKIDAGIHTAADMAGIAHTAAQQATDAVEEMEVTVNSHTSQLSTMRTELTTAQSDIQANSTAVQSLSTREADHYSTLSSQMTALNNSTTSRLTNYLTKGEANTLYASISTSQDPHWVVLGNPNTALWAEVFADLTHATLHTYTSSGGSIANLTTNVSNAIADTSYNQDLVERVLICGGELDVANDAVITTEGVITEVANLINAFPNAYITLVPFCLALEAEARTEEYRNSLYKRISECTDVVANRGIQSITSSYTWLLNNTSNFSSGTISGTGRKRYASLLYRYLTGETRDPISYAQIIGTGGSNNNGLVRLEGTIEGASCDIRWVYSHNKSTLAAGSWLYTLPPALRPSETYYTDAFLPTPSATRYMKIQKDGQVYMMGSQTTAGAGYSYMNLHHRII